MDFDEISDSKLFDLFLEYNERYIRMISGPVDKYTSDPKLEPLQHNFKLVLEELRRRRRYPSTPINFHQQ